MKCNFNAEEALRRLRFNVKVFSGKTSPVTFAVQLDCRISSLKSRTSFLPNSSIKCFQLVLVQSISQAKAGSDCCMLPLNTTEKEEEISVDVAVAEVLLEQDSIFAC